MNINGGTQGALTILRDTVLASMPDEDWSDVLKSVADAGGINARLVPYQRLMLAKAVSAYNDGVAKGDYVGHPFRGNQHSSASGAGRGSAGGGPKRRSTGRVGASEQMLGALNDELAGRSETYAETLSRVSTPAIDELRSHIEQQEGLLEAMRDLGATSQVIGVQEGLIRDAKADLVRQEDKAVGADTIARGEKASQDKQSNQKNAFAAAEAMIATMYKDQMGSAEQAMIDDQQGIATLAEASKSAIRDAQMKADQEESYGEGDGDLQVKAVAVKRAEERVMQLGMDVRTQLSQVVTSLKAINKRIDDKGISESAQTMVNQTLKGYKAPLESLRKKLRDAGTREQQAAKIGLGSSGASMRLAMMQSATSNAIEQINDLMDQAENAGTDAEELSREMGDDY